MKEKWKQYRKWAIAVSSAILILGIFMIIWPKISALVVCFILGIVCLIAGINELFCYFKLGILGILFRYDLALGISSIFIGLLLFIHPAGAFVFLPIAVGFYIIIESIFNIQLSMEMKQMKMSNWWVTLLLGIVSVVFAFFLFFDPFDGVKALMIYIGFSLVISSIQSYYLIYCLSRMIKIKEHENVIEVEWDECE